MIWSLAVAEAAVATVCLWTVRVLRMREGAVAPKGEIDFSPGCSKSTPSGQSRRILLRASLPLSHGSASLPLKACWLCRGLTSGRRVTPLRFRACRLGSHVRSVPHSGGRSHDGPFRSFASYSERRHRRLSRVVLPEILLSEVAAQHVVELSVLMMSLLAHRSIQSDDQRDP